MKKNIEKAGLWIFLVLMSVLMLFPIYFMVIASLKPTSELFRNGIRMAWQFDTISLENYQYTFSEKNGIYLTWYANSILVMIISTGLSLFFSSMAGYALGAYRFKGRKFLFVLTMIVMMIPLEILLIPLYKMIIKMKLLNTKTGSILPFLIQPTAMFFFQQFASGISKDYMDAARADGCTELGI